MLIHQSMLNHSPSPTIDAKSKKYQNALSQSSHLLSKPSTLENVCICVATVIQWQKLLSMKFGEPNVDTLNFEIINSTPITKWYYISAFISLTLVIKWYFWVQFVLLQCFLKRKLTGMEHFFRREENTIINYQPLKFPVILSWEIWTIIYMYKMYIWFKYLQIN